MDVKPPAVRTAVETGDRNILDFAMALAGVPRQDRNKWLTQTQERVTETLTRGTNAQVVQTWSEAGTTSLAR